MGLAVVRKRPGAEVVTLMLCGLLAGVATGFLLSEVFGAGGHRRIGRIIRTRRAGRDPARERDPLIDAVREALAAEPSLQPHSIEVRIRGERGLELRGWVATRRDRALAFRLARAASDHLEIANRLQVRGDDESADQPARGDAPRTA